MNKCPFISIPWLRLGPTDMLFFRQREHRVTLSSSDLGDEEGLLESQSCSLTEEAHLTNGVV